jgi:hypothetical protein
MCFEVCKTTSELERAILTTVFFSHHIEPLWMQKTKMWMYQGTICFSSSSEELSVVEINARPTKSSILGSIRILGPALSLYEKGCSAPGLLCLDRFWQLTQFYLLIALVALRMVLGLPR